MAREPSSKTIESWNSEISKSGVKRLKARVLLKAFGAERRGSAILERMQAWSRSNGLHLNGLEYATSLDDVLTVSRQPIRRIGRLVELESELTRRFAAEMAPTLGVEVIEREYSPPETLDRFDFLCRDTAGRHVIVEIKRGDGERRAVEQVLRYIRVFRSDPNHKPQDPRGLIITGEADLATRRALQELEPGYKIDWWLYGVRADGTLALEPEVIRQ